MNDLLHFSKKPLGKLRDTKQGTDPDTKPGGFWVSVGPSWAEWCLAESFNTSALVTVTRVVLHDDANILRLSGSVEIDLFHREFAADGASNDWQRDYIRWDLVARQYDGIVITPYCWERRLNGRAHRWYYGWDCASGCIWKARAIARTESIDLAQRQLETA